MRALGVIVARGASKRLPRKNLRPLLGTPLIAWAVRVALASTLDRVVVSTEDEEIAAVARQFGAEIPFWRPHELAADYARSDDILLHALATVEAQESQGYGVVVYLQPTTPFVQPGEINACVEKVRCGEAACCFTAREVSEPPWWMFRQDAAGRARLLLQGSIEGDREHSQKLERVYLPSGAVWALDTKALRAQHRIYCEPLRIVQMPYERSIDIDDETDWIVAETLARHYRFNIVPAPGPRL